MTNSDDTLLGLILSSLEDDKGQDIKTVDLAGKTSLADFMVIVSGTSSRHVMTLADHLRIRLKNNDTPALAIEGEDEGDWIVVDTAEVIVHIFRPEVREYYDLERLWEAPMKRGAIVKI